MSFRIHNWKRWGVALTVFLALGQACTADPLLPSADWKVSFSPGMKGDFKIEGSSLVVQFTGATGSDNQIDIEVPCTWTVTPKTTIEATVKSSGKKMQHHFVIRLNGADGKSYQSELGTPPEGFFFFPQEINAEVFGSEFTTPEGPSLSDAVPLRGLSLLLTVKPGVSDMISFGPITQALQ